MTWVDGDLRMDRYLVHDCPDYEQILLPPSSDPTALFRSWRCEFCGFVKVED